MLLAKLGPRLASAALAGLSLADEAITVRSASDSIRTRLCGLVVEAAAAVAPPSDDVLGAPVASAAATSSALLFLLGLIDVLGTAAVVEAAELPTRLQKSA